jgi:hypothetical protein
MITAEKLTLLTNMPAAMLTMAAQDAGYKGPEFTSCRFLGITNGGQFCYNVVFHVKGGTDSTKIFLTYNPAKDQVIADYHLTELA